ncbi:MAG: PCI domain-containing protein [archaeon]|nr:PCI domain-containing protein [archaeon]
MSDEEWGNPDDDGGFGSGGSGFVEFDPEDGDGGFGSGGSDSGGGSSSSSKTEDPATLYENTYYEAQDAFDTGDRTRALGLFERVLEIEGSHPEVAATISEPYGFFSLRETVLIYHELGQEERIVPQFLRMLEYLPRRVGIAKFEEAFYLIMTKLARFKELPIIQEKTLSAFRALQQDLPRVRVLLRVARQLFAARRWADLRERLEELKGVCSSGSSGQDQKGAQLIEVWSLELQMHELNGEEKQAHRLWMQRFAQDKIGTPVVGPEVKAPIDFVGGKILLSNQLYADASNSFYRAMGFYDDVGNQEGAEKALRYRLVAEMLKPKDPKKNVDPFAEARSKIYMSRPNVVVFYSAYQAFQKQQVKSFIRIFDAEPVFSEDAFIRQFRDELTSTLRMLMLAQICQCYSSIRLSALATTLRCDVDEVERLLCISIHTGRLSGSIDQTKGIYITARTLPSVPVETSISRWANGLLDLNTLLLKISSTQ